jgi:hypothetical protein
MALADRLSGNPDAPNGYCVRDRTDPAASDEYLPAMKAARLDLTLAVHVSPGDTYEWSTLLLARANADGTLELLTAAWGKFLGYGRQELTGKTLRWLMGASPASAARAVAAILDEDNTDAVHVTLRTRRGEPRRVRMHRRHDAYTRKMFIVAEEIAGETVRWQTDGAPASSHP